MEDRRVQLKIKIKTLAAEASIIRKEERKAKKLAKKTDDRDLFWSLRNHRTGIVSDAARWNLLAYGMLRGVPYHKMENKVRLPPGLTNLKYIVSIAKRFAGKRRWNSESFDQLQDWQDWLNDAIDHLKSQGYTVQCPDLLQQEEKTKITLKHRKNIPWFKVLETASL